MAKYSSLFVRKLLPLERAKVKNFVFPFALCSLIRNFAVAMSQRKDIRQESTRRTSLKEKVLATMKSRDTESDFELYMTRTPGYLWAVLFRRLHVHPIAVTLMSIVIGAAAGYFFWFDDLGMNLIGMVLLVWANWYDCADGQLARMTGQKTLVGRILDGFAGDVWFFSIYLFLCLRLTPAWGLWIWLLAAWAGLHCHVLQCNIADYYRNIHLWFLSEGHDSELTSSCREKEEYRRMSWMSRDWFQKLYLFFYIRYTQRQERQCPAFQRFYDNLREKYSVVPADLRRRFLDESRPLMKYTNILTFDTRVGVLFLSLLAGVPWVYFVFECTVLEALRYYTIHRHEAFCQRFDQELEQAVRPAPTMNDAP